MVVLTIQHSMKKILLLFILVFLGLSSFAQKQNYVIGFYNVENLFDIYDDPVKNDAEFLPDGKNKWTQAKYEKKLHNIARVINAMRDENGVYHTILGVSEIENRLVLEDLVSLPELASANYQIVHYDGPDRRGVDVGLLYRPDQFTYEDSESIPFTFEGSKVKITLDEEEQQDFRTRDILMVRGKIDGEDIAVYVAHLPSRLGGKGFDLRSRGAEIIYDHACALKERFPDIKIVVMGDMNDNPTDESMAVWLHGKEKIGDMGPEDFFCPFTEMLAAGYGSLAYRGVWNIYDNILVDFNLATAPDGGLVIRPVHKKGYYGRIFKKPFMTQQSGQYKGTPFRTFSNGAFVGGYSDHYPTYIVIGK